VVDSWIAPEGKYGFVEFRSIDECTAAIALNGISLQGRQLVIKRPNDYEPAPAHIPTGVALTAGQANATSSVGLSGLQAVALTRRTR
jgi:splicing factor U2AF subunit